MLLRLLGSFTRSGLIDDGARYSRQPWAAEGKVLPERRNTARGPAEGAMLA